MKKLPLPCDLLYQWSVLLAGKDIIRFHAVMWPALLMSAGFAPPQKIFGHGFLTKDGLKMGKALGNVLDPVALVEAYGADAVRFFFMREIRFGQVRCLSLAPQADVAP